MKAKQTSKSRQRNSEIRNSKSAIPNSRALVAIVMGSQSDWDTMRHASETLDKFGVAHECRVISAHRSPQLAADFSSIAEANRDWFAFLGKAQQPVESAA